VAEVELDGRVVGPLEAVHAELRPQQAISGRYAVLVGHAHHQQGAVAEEHQLSTGPQQARGLGDPAVRIGPHGGAVLADDEIEGSVPQRHMLAGGPQEREAQLELVLELPGDPQLSWGRIDADRKSPAARQPGRHICRPAADLDGVGAFEVPWQASGVGLGNLEYAPGGLCGRPLPVPRVGPDASGQIMSASWADIRRSRAAVRYSRWGSEAGPSAVRSDWHTSDVGYWSTRLG